MPGSVLKAARWARRRTHSRSRDEEHEAHRRVRGGHGQRAGAADGHPEIDTIVWSPIPMPAVFNPATSRSFPA
jgi:hypothetical protein